LAHKKTLNFRLKNKDARILSEIIWDAEVANLDLVRDKFAIIERALMYGREEHIRWVHSHYSPEDIASVVRLSLNLDDLTANYWSIRLHIPREEIKCFQNPQRSFKFALNRQIADGSFIIRQVAPGKKGALDLHKRLRYTIIITR